MASSHPITLNNNHNASTNPVMATNPTGLPYNNHNVPNNKLTAITVNHLPQHQQQQHYQQAQRRQIISPVVSPVPPQQEQINVSPSYPTHSPVNINLNTMAWQHLQQQQQQQQPQRLQQQLQQPQLITSRSHDSEDNENTDTGSDVSSIPMGSIRPDPNYDPAKDPLSPERIDQPFVAPSEITITVVRSRRRKTMGSYQSSTTHSTIVTPPHSSVVEDDNQNQHPKLTTEQQPDWLQSPETGNSSINNIPMLGLINSFASDDATDSNSFSGSTDQFQSAEERMHLEEEMLELQELQGQCKQFNDETTKQRKGMVRREFNRRILRFKKKKNKDKDNNKNPNTNTHSERISGENSNADDDDNDDDTDASGNKIIIKLKIDDDDNANANTSEPTRHPFKIKGGKSLKPHHFGVRKHNRSHSLQMILGQENGC
jgi:hypothetical protein